MKSKYSIVVLFLLSLVLVAGCSKNVNSSVANSPVVDSPKGLNLELIGVGKENESIYYDNFTIVKDGLSNLLYRKTEDIKQLSNTFVENRTDLENGKMIYDANKNRIDFIYYYQPNPKDIYIEQNLKVMVVNLASYDYIGTSISSYIYKCTLELQKKNVLMKEPEIYISYFINDDKYLMTYHPSQFKIVFGVKLPGKDIIPIEGYFASGLVKATVRIPTKTPSGDYSSEYALLQFFNKEK